VNRKSPSQLAEAIVADLWRLGAEPKRPVCRIAFVAIGPRGNEVQNGGMCRESLVRFVEGSIQKAAGEL